MNREHEDQEALKRAVVLLGFKTVQEYSLAHELKQSQVTWILRFSNALSTTTFDIVVDHLVLW